jgi:ferredoxin like protein
MTELKKIHVEKETVEAKLGLLDYKKYSETHIKLKDSSEKAPCVKDCEDRPCVAICPAKVYEWEAEHKKILVAYENCIECGACRMLCPYGNIECDWPPGGHGVKYKFG